MQNSGFFNSVNGDRKYKAEFFAKYFATFIGNGVFPNPSTNLQVIANNDMTITVKGGPAWINGYVYFNDSDLILPIGIADGVLSRIDRIVLQYITADRTIIAKVKKGAFASSPTAPVLQRDADAYELGIADIYITAGATSITQADITDLRLDTELCGIVHGTVEQVDTTTLFNQYLSWLTQKKAQYDADMANWTAQKKTDFNNWYNNITSASQAEIDNMEAQFGQDWDSWFSAIQSALDGDTAGNLLNLINNLAGAGRTNETVKGNADDIANVAEDLSTHKADNATETTTGHIQLATAAEVATGTIATKAVAPKNLKVELDKKIPKNLLSAAGDIMYASAANTPAKLAKGSDGQVLVLSGGLPTWGSASGGWIKIGRVDIVSNTSEVNFTNIPTKYSKLRLVIMDVKNTRPSAIGLFVRFNGDTTRANYQGFWGTGAAGENVSAGQMGSISNIRSLNFMIDIINETTKVKRLFGYGISMNWGSYYWDNIVSKITSIQFFNLWGNEYYTSGSVFELYGME